MRPKVKLIVGGVIASGVSLIVAFFLGTEHWHWDELVFWTALCLGGELFWVRTPGGDSAHSLAVTIKLAAIVTLEPASALLVIFLGTMLGDLIFRRSPWYRALYNGSQLLLAGTVAVAIFQALGGRTFHDAFGDRAYEWMPGIDRGELSRHLSTASFWLSVLCSGGSYIQINNGIMAWLMSAMTGKSMKALWKDNCASAQEIQGGLTVVLLTPLFILLYGLMGVLGVILLFGCLLLVHHADLRSLALIATQDSLIRSERMAAMGDMAEEIGRDLGQYLTELRNRSVSLVLRAEEKGSERDLKSAHVIEVNVDNMSSLIEGLVAFSHKNTERIPSNLNELIRSTVDFVRPQNRFDHLEFVQFLDPILPEIPADPAQIQQVLLNLFANAADALRDRDGGIPRITIETRFDAHAQRVRIIVSDNGPGIPEEHLNRIFEPHFTTKTTGHGYGLSLVFRIAANHRAEVTASNNVAGGARFLLDFPCA